MPSSQLKPSDIAAEAKQIYIPYIRNTYSQTWPAQSSLYYSGAIPLPKSLVKRHCRFAFYERDPVDVALDWADADGPIPVIMPADERRAGGNWEANTMLPEECLCRRSNLCATLNTPKPDAHVSTHYPIPTLAGIYSEKVVVFRNGPDKYQVWEKFKALPIISVPPVRRPRLDSSGKKYSFNDERNLMQDKIKTALRIAVHFQSPQIVISSFGLGPGFRNPPMEVANMWKQALLDDQEFSCHFSNVVFAFHPPKNGAAAGNSSRGSSSSVSSESDLAIFEYVFKPANIHRTYR